MADVFISYSKGEADNIAQQIADALIRAGISCWYMGRDSRYGRYPDKIPKAIRECSVFVLILNQDSNKSKDVLSEVNIAFKYDKEILPVHIDNCEMSDALLYHLSAFTSINANPPNEQRIQELVEEIVDILGWESPLTPLLKPQPPPAKIIQRGKCGNNVSYTLDKNGVLTIFGEGSTWDFKCDISEQVCNTPWWDNRKIISHVEIQYGVTAIGHYAFHACERLISIAIPDSVTSIGWYAFSDCVALPSLAIPDRTTFIGEAAFDGCVELTSVAIPDSVTFIEDRVFRKCAKLTSVIVPDRVTFIGDEAFNGCVGLTSVTIPDRVTFIGEKAFYGCVGLTSVTIPDRVTSILNWAFCGCTELKNVTIPDSVTFIGKEAFANCVRLTGVSIPEKVSAGIFAFPDSVRIERRA